MSAPLGPGTVPDSGPDSGPDSALADAVAARLEAEALGRRIAAAQARADEAAGVVTQRRTALSAEEADVRRLERLSWSRILVTVRGERATATEKERAERDAALYAVREAEALEAREQAEVAAARARLDALGDTGATYVGALAAKEVWCAEHEPALSARVSSLAERRGVLLEEERELREAYDAGVTAHNALADAASMLGSAHAWSSWDTFMGGGLITDLIKHDKLDTVRDDLARANEALRKFADELGDLGSTGVGAVDVGPMLAAFDVWFDNIFSDWSVMNRIQDAINKVARAVPKVTEAVDGLRARRQAVADELDALAAERERLLTR